MRKSQKKDYEHWTPIKMKLNNEPRRPSVFCEGELWWCTIGENVGVEVDGKKQRLSRPVLIIKRHNKLSFFGVPVTSQKANSNQRCFYDIKIEDRVETMILSQARTWDAARLTDKIGVVSESGFRLAKYHLGKYLGLR